MTVNQYHELRKVIKHFKAAMLVTHTEDIGFHGRPMAIAQFDEQLFQFWFLTGRSTGKVNEINFDKQVHITLQDDRNYYVSASGMAKLVEDRAKVAELWQEPFKVWFPQGIDDPDLLLICVTIENAEYWDNAGTNKIMYAIESVKAYATGTKPQLQEGEQHGIVHV